MRSRYTAYTLADIAYIEKTLAPESRSDFDADATRQWADSEWKGLKILSTEQGQSSDNKGVVEFIASFVKNGSIEEHHERSRFRKDSSGQWFFIRWRCSRLMRLKFEVKLKSVEMIRALAEVGRNTKSAAPVNKFVVFLTSRASQK